MSGLRETVAAQLEALAAEAGFVDPWTDLAGATTRTLYAEGEAYGAGRLDLHEGLIAQRRAQSPRVASGHRRAVITAGPPGAGKSTAVRADGRFAAILHVDADDFKDPLLERARDDGLLASWTSRQLVDGKPVALRELAGFVHAESTVIADALRMDALDEGQDVVIHGTLSHGRYAKQLLQDLLEHDYRELVVVSVEASQAKAVERSLHRWWSVRSATEEPLGGRFQPPSAVRSYFDANAEESRCRANAEELARLATDVGLRVEVIRLD